jgi:D-alanyl-D-alanine carboxypeptidase
MNPLRTRTVAAAVLAVASVALVGCSSGNDSASSTTAKSSAADAPRWSGAARPTTPMSAANRAEIDTVAQEALTQLPDLPGLWLGVWDPTKGVYTAAYGKAVLPDTAATVADHNRIGSLTKTFTATAVLQQVEAGKLSLDDTVADVLPDLAKDHPKVGGITVAQLLGMRSGIPDYANTGLVLNKVVADPSKVWSPSEIVDLTLTESTLKAPGTPGYSTTNYLILGEMLAKVTGKSVEDVLNGVAKEAGLKNTALTPPEDNSLPSPSSHGYLNAPGVDSLSAAGVTAKPVGDVTDWSASWGGAGGSMYSTVDDLGTWAATGFGNTLLSKATVARRLMATKVPDVGKYGLGVINIGKGWTGHTGQIIGWEAFAFYNSRTGATVVAMVNETGSDIAALAIVGQLYPEVAQSLL